jgi:hypothetical protein
LQLSFIQEYSMTKKKRGNKIAVAPTQSVKGIGRMGQVENILNPTVVTGSKRGAALTGQLLGRQGKP